MCDSRATDTDVQAAVSALKIPEVPTFARLPSPRSHGLWSSPATPRKSCSIGNQTNILNREGFASLASAVRLPPLEILPETHVFWLCLRSQQAALCIVHCDGPASELWEQAVNIGRSPRLAGLAYRERDDGHTDDADLCDALASNGGEHAHQYFKTTTVEDIVVIGLAPRQEWWRWLGCALNAQR